MAKNDQLIHTKLRPPFIRQVLVSRPRLQEQIAGGLCGPLTLITAPAGFGKTTLVASAVSTTGLPVAWLSLDKSDNQEWRFLVYLVAALQAADPAIGCEAAQLLSAAQRATPEIILTSIINDVSAAGREMILVLDDYQVISSQEVHEQVTFVLEHCPQTFHLIIATRSDPSLPLARLRARGQLTELRTAEMRFTRHEADQFLNDVMDLHLEAGAIEVLEDHTEGWIAGLQMAALALQGTLAQQSPPEILGSLSNRDHENIRGFIEGFSGTHHYIMDYLLEEVLAVQPAEIQRFLLNTSILERLCAPLCDAVLADNDSGALAHPEGIEGSRSHTSTSILDYLDRANLFLIPLDDERKWYRYHHLFADLLRSRLQQTLTGSEIAALHSQAARWYEQQDLIYEAIYHASLIPNMEWVERLIEHNYLEMFRRMELASIRYLTGSLTKEMIQKSPWLCIYEAESRAWFGELDEADRLLAVAENHIKAAPVSPDTQAMIGHLSYVHSRVTAMRGDIRGAIALCITAREVTPASNHALHCGIGVMLGYAYFLDGDFPNAIQTLNETIQLGITAGVISTTIASYCVLARLYATQGQLQKAYATYQEARKYTQAEGSGHRGGTGIVDVGIAAIFYEWNDLDAALAHITHGMKFIQYWRKADDIALAYTTLAQIQRAQGYLPAAQESIETAAQVIHESGVFWEAREVVEAAESRMRLGQRNPSASGVRTLSPKISLFPGDPFCFGKELANLALARAYLAQKKPNESFDLLTRLEQKARIDGRTARMIEILILKALAAQQAGKSAQAAGALEILEQSLALAEPEGYVRIFVDEGEPVRLLLVQWLARASSNSLRDYAIHLLANFEQEPIAVSNTIAMAKKLGRSPVHDELPVMVESLSQRELEVLNLMALGKTNQEIAMQLVVATGTIKAHAARIYRKLDASNRTEAVANARKSGILP